MPCSNCNTPTCGCSGTYVVSATCPPTCSEVFNAQCIVYTGADILCGTDTVVTRNDYLDAIITNLVSYICTSSTGRDDTSVTAQAYAPAAPIALTHTVQQQYVQVIIIDTATNEDITKDFDVVLTSLGNYTIASASFTGSVRIIVIG